MTMGETNTEVRPSVLTTTATSTSSVTTSSVTTTTSRSQSRHAVRHSSHESESASDSDATAILTDHPDAPLRDATSTPPLRSAAAAGGSGGDGGRDSNGNGHSNGNGSGATVEELLQHDSSGTSTPRFIQDEGAWKRWKWVPYPVRRVLKATARWVRGPPTGPRRFRIQPLLPKVQHAPIELIEKFVPRPLHRALLVIVFLAAWIITFALVMRQGQQASEIPPYGTPTQIGCGAAYWASGNGCGVDGINCRPFTGGEFAFRCPAGCSSYRVLNPRAVGDQEVIYRPMVVGGAPAYRGDSFICGAAIHAGIISDESGGCGVVRLVGRQPAFNASSQNGISSVGFDSYFPQSFSFESGLQCEARDMRWPLLGVSVAYSTVFSLFVWSPALFFSVMFTGLFWTVGLATDTPSYTDVRSLFTRELGLFLPAALVAWVMFDKMGIRRTLEGLTAQVEKTVLWLGAAWVGALTNHTLDFIPIQRLTPHDLKQQPGAQTALAIIVILLVVIAASQVWFFQQEGRLVRHLQLYALFGVGLIICVALPGLNLRIHHYILALLLLPGTSMQTRPSLIYQGILVGLFINGIARWGWDPVLQTALALRNDAQLGSPLPTILEPAIDLAQRAITFAWAPPPGSEYDGLSVLVNDVERFRLYFEDGPALTSNVTWRRRPGDDGAVEYFRFAWMQGTSTEDYTKAGKWDGQGQWTAPAPGPSKIKLRARGDGFDERVQLLGRH